MPQTLRAPATPARPFAAPATSVLGFTGDAGPGLL